MWIDETLAEVPLFAGLSKKQLELVSSLTTRLEVPAGTVLTREGVEGYEFIIVLEGEVEVRQQGRLVATRGPGEYFGQMALVDHHPRTATVRSMTPVLMEVIARREFHSLLGDVPDIAEHIRATIAQRRDVALSATEEFVAQCSAAVKEDRGAGGAKEVVERTVRDRRLIEELPLEAGVTVLHGAEDLTILHVVMAERPVGAGNPIPHNHRLWAVIGVMHGSEENEFFRRSAHRIEPSGSGRVISEGEVLIMGDDTIHSVKNSSSGRLSSALHVYGGDLLAAEKTMWCEPDWAEEPFDFFRVIGS